MVHAYCLNALFNNQMWLWGNLLLSLDLGHSHEQSLDNACRSEEVLAFSVVAAVE